jgi:hypothetical protein
VDIILDRTFRALPGPGESFVSRPVEVAERTATSYFVVVSNQPGQVFIDVGLPDAVKTTRKTREVGGPMPMPVMSGGSGETPDRLASAAAATRTEVYDAPVRQTAVPAGIEWATIVSSTPTAAAVTVNADAVQGTGVVVDVSGRLRVRWVPAATSGTGSDYVCILHGRSGSA